MRSVRHAWVSRYFSARESAYATPSAGRRTILYVRTAGLSGTTPATTLTVFSPRDANSSMNVTQTHRRSNWIIQSSVLVLKKIASLRVVAVKLSFMMMTLLGVACVRIS